MISDIAARSLCLAVVMVFAFTSCERPDGGEKDGASAAEPSASQASPSAAGSRLSDVPDTVPPPPPKPVKKELPVVVDKEAKVSILGYHDFTDGSRRISDMVIHIDDFRQQMQFIKDNNMPVISMQDYLAWRRGEQTIPEKSVMITIDDGWKATHTLALPVLREFEYPFTVFLYKKYVGIGGRSLTYEEVRELMAGGASVGSHSVSHQSMISRRGKSDEEYDEWLRVELQESYQFLVDNFGKDGDVLKVLAYSFGIYSDYVVEKAKSYGYEAAVTVNGKKTLWDTPPLEVGRYIVYGKGDQNFSSAMAFGGGGVMTSAGRLLMEPATADGDDEGKGPQGPLVTTYPKDGEVVTERRPVLSMDVSKLEGVDPESIIMRVTGFGRVQHHFDEGAGVIRYQLPMSLRAGNCGVMVRFRYAGEKDAVDIAWNFQLDRVGSYLKDVDPELLKGGGDGAEPEDATVTPVTKADGGVASKRVADENAGTERRESTPAARRESVAVER